MNCEDLVEIGDIDEDIPFEVIQNAKLAALELLPVKSREKYYRIYNHFKDWEKKHGVKNISSTVMMSYFFEMDKKNYRPTSLWAYYSMLKATIRVKENIDIGKYGDVVAFLKSKSSGFKSVKAEVFTEQQIKKFFVDAADSQWLDVMVVCIFGICGACRTDEFLHITVKDVEKHSDSLYLVRLTQTKTKIVRSFTITGEFARILKKYIDLRSPGSDPQGRFFVNYQRGKCTNQFMGRNKFSHMPRRIAEFLQIPTPERYTGHSFRRTSATILANSGADIETIMRHGGWRSQKCAKGYIEDSLHYKQRTGNMITSSILGSSATSSEMNGRLPTGNDTISNSSDGRSSSSVVDTHSSSLRGAASCSSNFESFFDSDITDLELVQVIDRCSQQEPHQAFDSDINDSELAEVTDRCSQQEPNKHSVLHGIQVQNNGGDMVLTQGISMKTTTISRQGPVRHDIQVKGNETSTKSLLPDDFKQFHFEKMDNCTFNFYVPK